MLSRTDPYFAPAVPAGLASSNMTEEGYHLNLAVLRAATANSSGGFWNIFNAIPYGEHMQPTAAQLSWQALTSLAYGAKGLVYFTYWAPPPATLADTGAGADTGADAKTDRPGIGTDRAGLGLGLGAGTEGGRAGAGEGLEALDPLDPAGTFLKGGGLITPVRYGQQNDVQWERGPLFEPARRLNSLLRIFGDFLLKASSVGVYRHPPRPPAAPKSTRSCGDSWRAYVTLPCACQCRGA